MFTRAVKASSRLRLAISGPSGSGKTYTALRVASAMASRVALIDTEHGSASKYADAYAFDVLELSAPFSPDRYAEAIAGAAAAGYELLIIDSLSHAWNGPGGLLEIVDNISKRLKTTNTFLAWKEATPMQTRLIEALLSAPMHLIATMRAKQEYCLDRDDKGRTQVRKVGLAPVQRDGVEYEFDVFAEMDLENRMIVQKSRCSALQGGVYDKPGEDVAAILKGWLEGATPSKKDPAKKPPQKKSPNGGATPDQLSRLRELAESPFASAEMVAAIRSELEGGTLSGDLAGKMIARGEAIVARGEA